MIDLIGVEWRKGSRSTGNGACVEVAAVQPGTLWRKSSRSSGSGQCVEVAALDHRAMAVRDSKFPEYGAFIVSVGDFSALLDAAK
jgi:hypothetical protein